MAAGEGIEPSHTESESAVLPLDDPANNCNYNKRPFGCQQYDAGLFPSALRFFDLRPGVPERHYSVENERVRTRINGVGTEIAMPHELN